MVKSAVAANAKKSCNRHWHRFPHALCVSLLYLEILYEQTTALLFNVLLFIIPY